MQGDPKVLSVTLSGVRVVVEGAEAAATSLDALKSLGGGAWQQERESAAHWIYTVALDAARRKAKRSPPHEREDDARAAAASVWQDVMKAYPRVFEAIGPPSAYVRKSARQRYFNVIRDRCTGKRDGNLVSISVSNESGVFDENGCGDGMILADTAGGRIALDPEAQSRWAELHAALRLACNRLPERLRRIALDILDGEVDRGYSAKEAKSQGVSAKRIRQLREAAKLFLQGEMKRLGYRP